MAEKYRWDRHITKVTYRPHFLMKTNLLVTSHQGKHFWTQDFSIALFFRIYFYSIQILKQPLCQFCSFGHIKDEFAEDNEEDIEDIRQFLSQNKKVLNTVRRNIQSPSPYREEKLLYRDLEKVDNEDTTCKLYAAILGILLVAILFFLFRGGKKAEFQDKIEAIATNCWERFKSEKCDLNHPLGNMCRQLYDCYLREKNQRTGKQGTINDKPDKKNDSLIEEFVIAMLVVISGYFAGMERIKNGLGIVKRLIVQVFELVRQIRRSRQQK